MSCTRLEKSKSEKRRGRGRRRRRKKKEKGASLVSAAIIDFFPPPPPRPQPLAPEDELNWDDGTANPEYCVDRWDDVGKYQALRWLAGGLGVFGGALTLASVLDKRSTIPFAPRDYPFDSLKKELNGSKGVGPRD